MRNGCQRISTPGHDNVIMTSDQQPAIFDLQKRTREDMIRDMNEVVEGIQTLIGFEDEWAIPPVVLENSPVGESQWKDALENAIGRIHGQIRTIRSVMKG